MRLASRPPLAPRLASRHFGAARALLVVALAAAGCGSNHNPSTTSSSSGAETAVPLVHPPTSCEEGDSACSCVNVDVADYDRACNVAADCTAVTTGTFCGASSCFSANAAINVDSYQLWNTDRQPVEYASCVPATAETVACVSHACVLQYPGTAASSGDGGRSGGGGSGGDNGGSGSSDTVGSDDGISIDLTGGDDDDTGTTPTTTGDDDSSGTGSSSSGDDDDDDDKSESKHRPHASAVHAQAHHSAAVSDTLK